MNILEISITMFFVLLIMAAFVLFGLWVFVAIKSKAPRKHSNEWRNNYKPMATYKKPVVSDADEFDKQEEKTMLAAGLIYGRKSDEY